MIFKLDLSGHKDRFEEKRRMIESGNPWVFPNHNLAMIYWDGKDEEIMLRMYKDHYGLTKGIIETSMQLSHIRRSDIMYSGQLKHFDQLKYKNKSIDKRIIHADNQKIFKAIRKLGGNMESYLLVVRSYLTDPNLEKMSFEEADKLIEKKEAKLHNYKGHTLILEYDGNFYWKNEGDKSYCR